MTASEAIEVSGLNEMCDASGIIRHYQVNGLNGIV